MGRAGRVFCGLLLELEEVRREETFARYFIRRSEGRSCQAAPSHCEIPRSGSAWDKIACAVNASTMDRLKESTEQVSHFADKYGADQFFGSRADTETKEDLSYPNKLLRHFKNVGLFQVRYLLGYPQYKPAAAGKGRASMSESGEL